MLTQAQYQALKDDILLNADTNIIPMTNAGTEQIRALYNAPSTTDVWGTAIPVKAVINAIDWDKFTPVDSVPAADPVSGNAAIHQHIARSEIIQMKQMNLQTLLIGQATLDMSQAKIRADLRDAVIALPAGAGGASVTAGGNSGVNVLTVCLRKANRFEKLFSTGPVTTGMVSGNLLVIEGQLSSDDCQIARELP